MSDTLTVELGHELWLMEPLTPGDPLYLTRPIFTNRGTGEGVPGLVKGVLKVYKRGTVLEIIEVKE